MKIDYNLTTQVFVAATRDRTEGAQLKALGDWKWHGEGCHPTFCKRPCPAAHVRMQWWTQSRAAAARVKGEGVHTDASLAAIAEAPTAVPVAAPRVSFENGAFRAHTTSKEASDGLRRASGAWDAWKFHGGACSSQYCRKGCPAVGHYGLWTTDAAAVRALGAYLDPSAKAEIAKREASLDLSRAKEADGSDLACPPGRAYLPFQCAGIRYAMSRRSCLIADEMGLGKTVQAIGTVNADASARTIIVVCPAFLREVWRSHVNDWSVRETRVVVLEDSADAKRAAKNDLLTRKGDETLWVVISYGGARTASAVGKLLHAIESVDVLILDEAHRIKEKEAQQSKGVLAIGAKSKRVIGLTGTPIPNRPIEMATVLSLIQPGFNFWRYAKTYCGANETRFGWDMSGATSLDQLQQELRETCMIRRLKSEVLTELPAKRWSVITMPADGISADLRKKCKFTTSKFTARLQASQAIAAAAGDVAAMHVAINEQLTAVAPTFENASEVRQLLGLAKVPAAIEYIQQVTESGECAVVFAHHKEVARALYAALGGAEKCVYLDGEVDSAKRVALVKEFQASKTLQYVVATIESAKEGLTITRATRVIFVEQAWTPGTMAQAEDRAHRIGQTETVFVDYLVVDGTVDAYLAQLLAAKQRVAFDALDKIHTAPDAVEQAIIPPSTQAQAELVAIAHDPNAVALRAMRAARTTVQEEIAADPKGYAERTAARRGVKSIYEPTETEIAAAIGGMRALAAMDSDHAFFENEMGFSKADVYVGHALSALPTLTPELWALAAQLCRKYQGQIGEDVAVEAGVAKTGRRIDSASAVFGGTFGTKVSKE